MEAHGQGGQVVSKSANVFEKQPSIHSRYPTRHIPAFKAHYFKVRGANAYLERLRVFQVIYRKPYEAVEASYQTVQGRKR